VTDLSFYATASPGAAGFGSTGNRSFATSAAGAVWQNFTATPPVEVNGVFGGDGSTIIQ
jgi:hypothetical protein